MKTVRNVAGLARRRQRQLLGLGDRTMKRLAALSAAVFEWAPARRFARRFIVPRVLPQMMTGDIPTQEMAAVRKRLQQMAAGNRPILVGPWTSEVGFELLYWIPFLCWVTSYRAFDPERLIVVSRGGVGSWYRHITHRYVDVFDFYTPAEFLARNSVRLRDLKQKQLEITEFDREIVEKACQRLGASDVELLHPMYMYRLFYPFWKNKMSMHLVDEFASFRPLLALDASDIAGLLPDDFVAVRFYFNESFPETDENRAVVRQVIERLTQSVDVVLLNTDLRIDDHCDAAVGAHGRVHSVANLITPPNNLDIQTKIVSLARAFVGTYGGLSYLAPLCGRPAVGFYSDRDRFSPQHLDLARRVFAGLPGGAYVVLDTKDVDVLGLVLGGHAASDDARGQSGSSPVARIGSAQSALAETAARKIKAAPRAFSAGDGWSGGSRPVVPLKYGGASLRLYATNEFERRYRAHAGDREPWTVAWLDESVQPGDVVFDIGANVGPFSLIAATRVGASGRVYAFEPGYASFARLCDNIVLNELDERIVPVPMPLAATTGIVSFAYRSVHVGQSRHEMHPWPPPAPDPKNRFRQPSFAFRLDDLAQMFRLPPANHVKLDVDGAELDVLEGFGALLDAPSLRTLLVEIDRGLSEQVPALLGTHGFDLASRFERNSETPCWYGLFRR